MQNATDVRDGYVAVIGLGYVGLPLAASLAAAGHRVVGVDTDPVVRDAIRSGQPVFYEPGLADLLTELPGDRFAVRDRLPAGVADAVIVCIGTTVDPVTKQHDMRHLVEAVDNLTDHVSEDTVVIIRSTVPIGTCRDLVLPRLISRVARPLLAFCPERTIQGQALAELRTLPQIIGGLDEDCAFAAGRLLAPVLPKQVVVSTMETAEMIKLVCNSHTDLIYGFGNEVAMIAEGLSLDAGEVISSANLDYPRPNISKPGYVGGSCLVKDPYMLIEAGNRVGHATPMVSAARGINEMVPHHVLRRVAAALEARGLRLADSTVLVCGIAYKGRPVTDDVRGSAAAVVAQELGGRVAKLTGHDFLVPDKRIRAMGFEPVDLTEGLREADAVILLTDHTDYSECRVRTDLAPGAVVYDMWGVWEQQMAAAADATYLRLGRG